MPLWHRGHGTLFLPCFLPSFQQPVEGVVHYRKRTLLRRFFKGHIFESLCAIHVEVYKDKPVTEADLFTPYALVASRAWHPLPSERDRIPAK